MSILLAIALSSGPIAKSAAPDDWVDHQHQEILPEFRGRWALDGADCGWEDGPAFVTIGARHIYFYERYAYLELAVVNWLRSPVFYGDFHLAEGVGFSREPIRVERVGDKLSITEGAAPDTPRNNKLWHKCGPDEG